MALFIRMVEELEPEHFILLDYARDPGEWFERRSLQLSGTNPFPTMIDVMA